MSAFFISTLLFLNPVVSAATTRACTLAPEQKADETVTVSYVHDGDTLKLRDGRKLRIIGINTPELGNDNNGNKAEPLALKARDFLRNLIKKSEAIQIRYGVQKNDRYGRLLAHIFVTDKQGHRENISAVMLENGLARSLHVPPNSWQYRCYDQLDKQAQRLNIGLWSNSYYKTVDVANLKPASDYKSQFIQVSGIVTRVADSKKNIWVNLGSDFALRINKSNIHAFNTIDFNKLPGEKITARGYVMYYPNKKQFRMLIRHPVALTLKNNSKQSK
ncbi:MAG: thermonuclease family protein [Gammaproteobacteria bacterium]